jgi:triosephosphate isomerase
MARKVHIVGNWKMNQNLEEIKAFFIGLSKVKAEYPCEAWIAPQFIHLPIVKELAFTTGRVLVGAQNCSHESSGAFTGDISPASLADLGAHFTLVGHSERRAIFNEDHELLNQKTLLALENGLKVIFCVGETLEEREIGSTEAVLKHQLDNGLKDIPADKVSEIIVAYEPVWAIGTGKTATPEQAEETHVFIRSHLAEHNVFTADDLVILYGGSVKPSNVTDLLGQSNIDGALVGGASLKAEDYAQLLLASL